jgi:hypothetical protein
MAKVSPPWKNRARKLRIIRAEPNSVNRKNLMAAYWRASPPQHPDHEVHGQQHDLEEHEEQDQVLGHEGAVHPHLQHQDQDQEGLGVVGLGEVVPGVDDHQHAHEHRQQQQRERDTVDAEDVATVDDVDPRGVDLELHGVAPPIVETDEQVDAHGEGHQGGEQGDHLVVDLVLPRGQHHGRCPHDGQENRCGQCDVIQTFHDACRSPWSRSR